MRNFGIVVVMLAILPSVVLADPSVSSDAGRSIENSQSTSIKTDKSLSADKARGTRATESDSRERAIEASRARSHQERVGRSTESSQSKSVDVNINGLLLKEFAARYERGAYGAGTAWEYFHTCKPLMNALKDYPVWNISEGGVIGRTDAMQPRTRYLMARGEGSAPPTVDPSNRYISRYSQCRITASYWLAEAGKRSTSQAADSEEQVLEQVRQAFSQMDSDSKLFQEIRQRARDVWSEAICSNWLDDFEHFQSPAIECGVFSFVGNSFTVENRETLGEGAIDGRSYKVSISAQDSQSASVDDSMTSDTRVSRSEREGDSRERYRESKKTASLSKSKAGERNTSSSFDRSAGNSMNASPSK